MGVLASVGEPDGWMGRVDVSRKLVDYFQVPSVHHYLILFADRVRAIHHRRAGDRIEARVLSEGNVTLDPPGIAVPLAGFYPAEGPGPIR